MRAEQVAVDDIEHKATADSQYGEAHLEQYVQEHADASARWPVDLGAH